MPCHRDSSAGTVTIQWTRDSPEIGHGRCDRMRIVTYLQSRLNVACQWRGLILWVRQLGRRRERDSYGSWVAAKIKRDLIAFPGMEQSNQFKFKQIKHFLSHQLTDIISN